MSLCEKISEVLPRMLMAGKEECDLSSAVHGEHARREGAASSLSFIDRKKYFHRRIVKMDDLALRCLPDQFFVRRMGGFGISFDDVPLGGGRKRDAKGILQRFEPVEGNAGSVLEQGDHGACGGIVFLRSCVIG